MRRHLAFVFWLALAVASDISHGSLSPRSASATTVVELSVADLVSMSTLVLAGTPLESRSLWEDSAGGRGRRIVTYTRVRVDRMVDGDPKAEVWVRTLGGQVDDIGQHVDGEAVLVSQRPVLLFLRGLADGTHAVVGMAQGQYPIEAGPGGSEPKLMTPPGMGRLVARTGAFAKNELPARLALSGQSLDVASRLVLAERRAHAR